MGTAETGMTGDGGVQLVTAGTAGDGGGQQGQQGTAGRAGDGGRCSEDMHGTTHQQSRRPGPRPCQGFWPGRPSLTR